MTEWTDRDREERDRLARLIACAVMDGYAPRPEEVARFRELWERMEQWLGVT